MTERSPNPQWIRGSLFIWIWDDYCVQIIIIVYSSHSTINALPLKKDVFEYSSSILHPLLP